MTIQGTAMMTLPMKTEPNWGASPGRSRGGGPSVKSLSVAQRGREGHLGRL